MFITCNNRNTHPAKEFSTLTTYHFITPINLLYCKFAIWTFLSALSNVKIIFQFFYLSTVLGFLLRHLLTCVIGNFKSWASLELVILLLTCQTKHKVASWALTKVFNSVYLCRWWTHLNRTPAKVLHLLKSLINGKGHHLLNTFFIKTKSLQVIFVN